MKTNKTIVALSLCILALSGVVTAINAATATENPTTTPPNMAPQSLTAPVYGNWTYSGAYNGSVSCFSIAPSTDGGYVLAGQNMNIPTSFFDAWLLKVDSTGAAQWNKSYGPTGPGAELAYSIINCSDGGYAFTGYTTSYGAGSYDMWLVKVDENGTQEWMQTYGGTDYDGGTSVIATTDGGYMVVGFTNSSATQYDFFVVKTDATGNLVWSKTFGGLGWERAYGVVETADGGFAVVGSSNSSGQQDGLLIKLDSYGNQLWNKTYGSDYPDSFRSIVITSTGFTMLGGISPDFNHSTCWLVNVDVNGGLLWNKTYGGSYYTASFGFIMTNDGGYVFTGVTNSVNAGYPDLWL
ncbi:MAG TPA: hypothetical protein VLH35_00295, partial [Candidatus Acidoferrales bacterium]|nr:hypothetical protein [Candidatus Acidoferrales bacterium]